MGEKRSPGDSQGVEEDAEAGISVPLDRPTLEEYKRIMMTLATRHLRSLHSGIYLPADTTVDRKPS
ncbi:hypothetical protein Celaphus_00006938 [Cervus elaphus hippelaphus]|uniref:Uncharacterized protein n=1 Tax=Cervus elaphus hippelaphus TaxID=46360 RepID=A0A212CYI6_CEREH|nr:hypothetical protein Celaphus_00006938 [Cervus elaphus hippelaphus]